MDEIATSVGVSAPSAEASGSRSTPERRIDEAGRTLIKWGALWLREEVYKGRMEKLVERNKTWRSKAPSDDAVAESYRRTLAWVLEHIWEDVCPKGATGLAKSLWKAAEARKAEFVSENMPLLVRGEKAKDDEPEDEAVASNIELIEEWFRQRREEVCPTCHRSGWKPGAGEANEH